MKSSEKLSKTPKHVSGQLLNGVGTIEKEHFHHCNILYMIREEDLLFSTHHGKTAKLQTATTTPFLYFPGKDVRNLVLNRKDPLCENFQKSRTFLSLSEHRAMLCDYFQPLVQIGVGFQNIVL